jgi:hypothetical protein
MATNLAGGVCLGQHSACILRAAKLATDCSPLGGADSGIISNGISTITVSADVQDAIVFEPVNGCGDIAFTYEKPARVRRRNITGELIFHDWEMMETLFGGSLVIGSAGSDFPTDVIGWAEPDFTEDDPDPVYFEVIVRTAARGAGECSVGGAEVPYAVGHIFGRARLTLGDRTFENDVANVAFTGVSASNPALFNGPWNDYPGVGYIPTSPWVQVAYSRAEYDAIADLAGCGYKTLPAAS